MCACMTAAGQPYSRANVQMQGSNLECNGMLHYAVTHRMAHHETAHSAAPPRIFTFCLLNVQQPDVDCAQQGLFYAKEGN